jgi:hypothetical protein
MSNNIEKLKAFKINVIGTYKLNKLNNLNPFGCIYLDNLKDWNELKGNKIFFNLNDDDFKIPFAKIKEVMMESIDKSNYIILKLDSDSSSVSFYLNSLPRLILNDLIELTVNKTDFIGSTGELVYDEKFIMSLIINDPSKELDVVKTDTTNTPSSSTNIFDLKTKAIIPIGIPLKEKIYAEVPNVPPGVGLYNSPEKIKKVNDVVLEEKRQMKILYPLKKNCMVKTTVIIAIFVIIFTLYFQAHKNL